MPKQCRIYIYHSSVCILIIMWNKSPKQVEIKLKTQQRVSIKNILRWWEVVAWPRTRGAKRGEDLYPLTRGGGNRPITPLVLDHIENIYAIEKTI